MAVPSTSLSLRPVTNWLFAGAVMIACMVVLGGITRLTGSGLSITEWKPIMGALPPMNEAEWNVAFEKYKAIPEYQLVNQHLDLPGFKGIFFWEYMHRNWGRLMGLVFAVPFIIFWRQGRLKGWLMRRTLWILLGGAVVASLGWFMVMSGLVDEVDANGNKLVDVSHYRLAIHLCGAFIVFAIVLWTILDIRRERRAVKPNGRVGRWARWLLVLLALQIVWGAFTAGLGAGHIYNTWPLMNGEFMPENVCAFGNWVTDFTGHRDGVQFIHRNLAYLVALGMLLFALLPKHERALAKPNMLMLVMVLVQFLLGVLTIVWQVPIVLGVLHQFGAVLLLCTVLNVMHKTGRTIISTPA